MANSPKVSVIIPCYNHGRYIEEAVDSVLASTFQDFEIIIVDDCSNDGATPAQIEEVAKKDERIKVVTQPENAGLPSARNVAIEKAQGVYILPLDADDMIAPTYLERATKALDEKRGDVIYPINLNKFGKSNRVFKIKPYPEKWLNIQTGLVCCSMYKRQYWEKYGGYKNSLRSGWEDWEFWLCFVEDDKKFFGLDGELFYYRIADNASSADADKKKKELLREIKELHPKLYTLRNYYLSPLLIKIKIKDFIKFLFHFRWSSHKKYIRILGIYFINKQD